MDKAKHQSWEQLPNGYLSRTPMFQFVILCLIFPLWGAAASLNDILITQFNWFVILHYRLWDVLPGFTRGHLQHVPGGHLRHCDRSEFPGNQL